MTFPYRLIIYLLVAGLALALFFLWLGARDKRLSLEAAAEQGQRTDQAASGITRDLSDAVGGQRGEEAAVSEVRIIHQHQYEEVRRANPVVRDWTDSLVPDELRNLARERRLARERLGCAGDGCGDVGPAERASREHQTR